MAENERNVIVTGAYGAIGKAIAEGIAREGHRVTLVGRDITRLEMAREELAGKTSNSAVFIEAVDLSLQKDIFAFSKRWNGPLDLLVNNAATGPRKRMETQEGIEVQWATNVLGYFWMIRFFSPFMEGRADARIVNVASYWAGGMDLHDPEFRQRPYDNDAAYRQAKQADRMLAAAFSGRLKGKNISVNACHPGDVNSKLSNFFGFGGHESPAEGAATPLYLALSPDLKGVTGKYYEHMKPIACPFARDAGEVKQLYRLCSSYEML